MAVTSLLFPVYGMRDDGSRAGRCRWLMKVPVGSSDLAFHYNQQSIS
jgi:hypothetical protein